MKMRKKCNQATFLILIVLFIFTYHNPIIAGDTFPSCDQLYKEIAAETYDLSPSNFLHALVFKNPITLSPDSSHAGDTIQVRASFPAFTWESIEDLSVKQPSVFLHWEDASAPGTFNKIRMEKSIEEKSCKYKKSTLGIFSSWKTTKRKTRVLFTASIPAQKNGTTINTFIKAFFTTFNPLLAEKEMTGNAATLPVVQNLWDDKSIWDSHALLETPGIGEKSEAIEKSQVGFDGTYLYFRLKTKDKISEGCAASNPKMLPMSAHGVVIVTPEYAPLEKGHEYFIRGWVLAYSPCINKMFSAPDLAFYESSTFKKGPLANAGTEYKFLSENDILLRLPYEKIQPNPSKLLAVLFMVANTKDTVNPVGSLTAIDSGAHLLSLEKYSFTVGESAVEDELCKGNIVCTSDSDCVMCLKTPTAKCEKKSGESWGKCVK